ncbi:MAG: hypothetical protein HYS08_01350 [Chlamydiae bacterium]|nr:hypothetical protein [Chlamydiota bacterium]MBI3265628.1 hypothetical protein [Chlamydiota bacterium]
MNHKLWFYIFVVFFNVIFCMTFSSYETHAQVKKEMSAKDLLKSHALEVNDLLTAYIELHDDALKESGTFESLFRHVDFESLHKRSIDIHSRLSTKQKELEDFYKEFYSQADPDCRLYYDALHIFVERLTRTTALLEQRQLFLYKKAKGEGGTFSDYMKIEKEYQNSVNDYMEAGNKLNQLN